MPLAFAASDRALTVGLALATASYGLLSSKPIFSAYVANCLTAYGLLNISGRTTTSGRRGEPVTAALMRSTAWATLASLSDPMPPVAELSRHD